MQSQETPVETPAIEAAAGPTLPHPLQLTMDWAGYLDAPTEQLPHRIASLIDSLDAIFHEIDYSILEQSQALRDQISNNLKVWNKLKQQQGMPSPVPTPFKESYTVDDQVEIINTLFEIEKNLALEEDELRTKQSMIEGGKKDLERMQEAYFSIDELTTEKFLTGLSMMGQEISLLLMGEEARLIEQRAGSIREKIALKKNELQASQKTLVLDGDAKELENDIAVLTTERAESEGRIYLAETVSREAPIDTEFQRAERQLLQENILNHMIAKTLHDAKILSKETQLTLLTALTAKDNIDSKALNNTIAQWEGSREALASKLSQWQELSLQEQLRIGQTYATLINSQDIDKSQVENLHHNYVAVMKEIFSNMKQLELKLYHIDFFLDQIKGHYKLLSPTVERWTIGLKDLIIFNLVFVKSIFTYGLFEFGRVSFSIVVIIKIIIIICATFYVSHFTRETIKRLIRSKKNISESNVFTINILLHYAILFLGILFALSAIGLNLSNFAIILGALSVGIGFGLQAIVNNFLCGIILLFTRNVKVGDVVQLSSLEWGKIISINIQNTIIQTYDGTEIIVPNSEMVVNKMTNWTMKNNYMRLHVPFGVEYGVDKDLVKTAALEAADRVPITVKGSSIYKDPEIWLVEFGDSSLNFELVVWINVRSTGNHGSFTSSYLWEIETSLSEHNITIPFPQRDLNIKEIPK